MWPSGRWHLAETGKGIVMDHGQIVGSERVAIEPAVSPALPVRPTPPMPLADEMRARNRRPVPPHMLARVKAALGRLPPTPPHHADGP
jgi:hypothetical protein